MKVRDDKSLTLNGKLWFSVLFFSVLILFADINGYLKFFRNGISYIITPIQISISQFSKNISNFGYSFVNISQIRRQNTELQIEVANLKAENEVLKILKEENEQLKYQLGVKVFEGFELVTARVVSYVPSMTGWVMRIDKGLNDGIKKGDTVVYGDNLIGYVDEIDNYSSTILLITNTKTNLLCQDRRSGAKGLLVNRKDGLFMEDVLQSDSLEIDDSIIKWDERFSIPLVVGKIVDIEITETSPTKNARIELIIPVKDLSYVFVLKGKNE